jgi:hypothetical protein
VSSLLRNLFLGNENYSNRSRGHCHFSRRIGLSGRVQEDNCWTRVFGWDLKKEWNFVKHCFREVFCDITKKGITRWFHKLLISQSDTLHRYFNMFHLAPSPSSLKFIFCDTYPCKSSNNGEGCWGWHLMEHIHNNLRKLGGSLGNLP